MHVHGSAGTPAAVGAEVGRADEGTGPRVPPASVVLREDGEEVEIRYVRRGASTSLMVTDRQTGSTAVLDATELESLARAPGSEVRELIGDIGDVTGRAGS